MNTHTCATMPGDLRVFSPEFGIKHVKVTLSASRVFGLDTWTMRELSSGSRVLGPYAVNDAENVVTCGSEQ